MVKCPTALQLRILLGQLKDEADEICPPECRTVEFRSWCTEATDMCAAFDRAMKQKNRLRRKKRA